jgi:hypothetical protein
MDVNDNAEYLTPRGVLKSIASRLAPTGRFSPWKWSDRLISLFI